MDTIDTLKMPDGAMRALQEAVTGCQSQGGGVVAVVGPAGFGKSVLAKEFVLRHGGAVYIDATPTDGNRQSAPDFVGIPVIDEAWQLNGITKAIEFHVTRRRGTAVVIAFNESEALEICGGWLSAIVDLPHLPPLLHCAGLNPACRQSKASDAKPAINTDQPIIRGSRGIIRFRGPGGQGWTGHGRVPKWLIALESTGFSRELYRIDATPMTRSKKS